MLPLFRDVLSCFSRRGGRLLAGAVAFYALLSVVPLFVLALRFAGLWASEEAAHAVLVEQLRGWLGAEGAATVDGILSHASSRAVGGGLASALSLVVLVYASTRLFSVLKRALNVLWGIESPSAAGFRGKVLGELRKRAVAFLLVMAVGLLLVGLVLLEGAVSFAEHALEGHASLPFVWRVVQATCSFGAATGLFALLFAVLPDARVSARDLFFGALFTAALFTLGSSLIVEYVGHKASVSVFGAAGSVVMLLLWAHYSAQVFLLGAAFTKVHAERHGRGVTARKVSEREASERVAEV